MSKTPIWDNLKANQDTIRPGACGAHDQALTNSLLVAQNELLERIACALERGPYVLLINAHSANEPEFAQEIKRAMETIWNKQDIDDLRERYGQEPFGQEMLQQQPPPIDEDALHELLEERRKTELSERRFKERSKLNEPSNDDQGRSPEDEARGETGQAHREAPEGDGGDSGLA